MDNIEYWSNASKIKKDTDPYQDRDEKIETLLKDITKNIKKYKTLRKSYRIPF